LIQKTITLSASTTYNVKLDFIKIDSWNDETAYVEIDGVEKWNQTMSTFNGEQECGGEKINKWFEERVTVNIYNVATNSIGNMNIKVYTDLDQKKSNESFGIDKVFIWKSVLP